MMNYLIGNNNVFRTSALLTNIFIFVIFISAKNIYNGDSFYFNTFYILTNKEKHGHN
jgi:hypothetical protein